MKLKALVLTVVTLVMMAGVVLAGSITFSGRIDTDDLNVQSKHIVDDCKESFSFNVPLHADITSVSVSETGSYTLEVDSLVGYTSAFIAISWHAGAYDQSDPSSNCVASELLQEEESFTATLQAGTIYSLVARATSSFEVDVVTGPYTVTVTGPGDVFAGDPQTVLNSPGCVTNPGILNALQKRLAAGKYDALLRLLNTQSGNHVNAACAALLNSLL